MSLNYSFRTIESWPWERQTRAYSQFKAGYENTIKKLTHELELLKAENPVIQLEGKHLDHQLRSDGFIRTDARVEGPAVIVSFQSKHGHLSYPCDRFTHWTDNLRAIALALENLRAVDRYGVTRRGEQYRGWDALPEPDSKAIILSYIPGNNGKVDKSAVREALRKAHPDHGGSHEEFVAVNNAAKALKI